jgi:cytidylate kinase
MHTCSIETLERAQRRLDEGERQQLQEYLERVLNALREKD